MTKTLQKIDIRAYMVKPPVQRKRVDWRDYVIPSKSKKKTNWSERVDEVVYGVKK